MSDYPFWQETSVTAPWNKNLGKGEKHNCSYTFYGVKQSSGATSKGGGACSGVVIHLNDAGLVDDKGAAYVASSYYSGNDNCQIYFTKTNCGGESVFSSDASHADVIVGKAQCNTKSS